MKFSVLILTLLFFLGGCAAPAVTTAPTQTIQAANSTNAVDIILGDEEILVTGAPISTDPQSAVYAANDIVYYEDGKDFTYGEGTQADAHTKEEADAHKVVHITKPGTYSLQGKLSNGQIAVDLGEDAKDDPLAVVNLILEGVDITCQVAPAVIFYNVYECGSTATDTATKDVDTSAAGANVVIADGTENRIQGAYVARIYKPDSVVLNSEGTQVEDAKKLHKYDAAFYSKMTMNVSGGEKDTGVLNIFAENEGLDSELHLTLNGGNINIHSGNDGINTNEDGVSVTTVNGGNLNILVTGQTGEGDGIDSNGWLVINGGTVRASACATSGDAGIDSDMGIHINGGTVIATGNMLDRIQDGGQTHAVFNFAGRQDGSKTVTLKNANEEAILEHTPENGYSILVFSGPVLVPDTYTLWLDDVQLAGYSGSFGGGFGGGMKDHGSGREERLPPEGMEFPEGMERPEDREHPEGGKWQNHMTPPEGMQEPQPGERIPMEGNPESVPISPSFEIKEGGNMFTGIAPVTE